MTYRTLIGRGWIVVILLFVAAAAALGVHLPKFTVDAGTHVMLNEDDADLAYYNLTRPDWGYDEYAIVCVHRDDWFTKESVALLDGFAKELAGAPHVRKGGVVSILSVPLLRSPESPIPLPQTLTAPKVDLAKARAELLDHTQAQGNLISKDGKDLSILVYLDMPPELLRLEPQWSTAQGTKDAAKLREIEKPYFAALDELRAQRTRMVAEIRRLAAAWTPRLGEIRLSGLPIINVNLVEHVADDLKHFGVASFAFFVLAFLAIYRKLRWTALPILTCLLPVVLIIGTMAATGMRVTVITSNLPVLLFVLMLPYTVYLIERYRERRSHFPGESQADATAGAASEIWTPCLYSCTTTMAGFASLLTSGINPVRAFGLMTTIGMGVGLMCVFLFLPSLFRPLRALEVRGAGASGDPRGIVRALERLVLGAPGLTVLLGAAILGISAWGTTKLRVETKFIDYFRSGSEVYRGLEYIDTRMGGTTPLEVLLTSKKPGFFREEAGHKALAAAAAYFESPGMSKVVGNVRTLESLAREVRKTKLFRTASAERLAGMKAAESLVREFVNEDATVSRVLVRFRETEPTLHRNNILRGLREHLQAQPELRDLEPRPTGIFLLYANMLNSLIQSQKDTFAMVVAAIWVMLVVLFIRFPRMSKGASSALATACFVAVALGLGAWLYRTHGGRTAVVLTETRWVLAWAAVSVGLVALTGAVAARGGAGRWLLDTFGLPSIVLVPQVLPVFVCLGTMGFTSIPLDLVTVMIASIAMGVGIDAAIQYTMRFRIEMEATGGDRRASITRSHATIGRAIWIATSIVVAGFVVLALSKFVPTVTFGLLTALAMLMGQFAALTLLPALFLLLGLPRRINN